jgi:excisionase family DNA binding protein
MEMDDMALKTEPLGEWLTLREAAAFLRVEIDTLRRWGRSGRFPFYRVGTKDYRVRRSDLDAFVMAGAVAPKRSARDLRVMAAAGNNSSVTTGSPRSAGASAAPEGMA